MGLNSFTNNNNTFFRQLLFITALIGLGVLIFSRLHFFVGSLLGAVTLYVIFRNLLFYLTERCGWRNWIAALLLVTINLCLILLGGFLIVKMVVNEIPSVDGSLLLAKFDWLVAQADKTFGFEVLPSNISEGVGLFATRALLSVVNTTYSFAANIIMMIVVLYFMFAGGRKMENYIYRYAPFKMESLLQIKQEVKNMIFSNAVGIPIIILGQALAATLIYWLLGLNSVFFWGFITGLCGLIPLVGTALVYVPIAIVMAVSGDLWHGAILIIYGAVVLSNVDNLLRILVMKKYANTHPLIVVFGVILGLPLFGFWGIIFGPLLISGFLLLVRIYYVEYGLHNDDEKIARLALSREQQKSELGDGAKSDVDEAAEKGGVGEKKKMKRR